MKLWQKDHLMTQTLDELLNSVPLVLEIITLEQRVHAATCNAILYSFVLKLVFDLRLSTQQELHNDVSHIHMHPLTRTT